MSPSRLDDQVFGEDDVDIELEDLGGKRKVAAGRDTRLHAHRRYKKLSDLVRREEMKFSHSIQFNAVPDWSSNYISYSNIKKL